MLEVRGGSIESDTITDTTFSLAKGTTLLFTNLGSHAASIMHRLRDVEIQSFCKLILCPTFKPIFDSGIALSEWKPSFQAIRTNKYQLADVTE